MIHQKFPNEYPEVMTHLGPSSIGANPSSGWGFLEQFDMISHKLSAGFKGLQRRFLSLLHLRFQYAQLPYFKYGVSYFIITLLGLSAGETCDELCVDDTVRVNDSRSSEKN